MSIRDEARGSTAPADDEAERLAELFMRVTRAMGPPRAIKSQSSAAELSLAQLRCLLNIARNDNCTLRELSELLGISPPSASSLVERLVNMDLVQRDNDRNDRRAIRLHIAPAGAEMLARHREEYRLHLHRFFSPMSAEQRRAMLSALEILEGAVIRENSPSKE